MKRLFLAFGWIFLFAQCKKDKNEESNQDTELYNESGSANGFTYYKNSTTLLASSSESPHGAYMRVRFNAIAQNALDSTGKLPVGSKFPDGSIIVKEVFDNNSASSQKLIAVMKKSAAANSASGYLWAEYNLSGGTIYSVSNKGASCTSCHSGSGNSDLVRVFSLFP